MATLAINGGKAEAGTLQIPEWPQLSEEDRRAVIDVLDSREWGRLRPNSYAARIERA